MRKGMNLAAVFGMAATMMIGGATTTFAAWQTGAGENVNRWWYDNENGTWAAGGWYWVDGNKDGVAECYYFDDDGWALTSNTTPDGYTVNEAGAWVENGIVLTKYITTDSSNVYEYNPYEGSTGSTYEESYDETEDYEDESSELDAMNESRWNREMAAEFVELLNEERAKKGEEELYVTDDAQYYAAIRAMQIVDNFSHSVDENDYIVEAEYGNEYCAKDIISAKDAIKVFKASNIHWHGLMGLYDVAEFAVSFYRMDNGAYTVSVNANSCIEEGYTYADCIK